VVAASPCPPTGLSVDGVRVSDPNCIQSSGGGVRNGELFSTDFATGTVNTILDNAWGDKVPEIVADPTAMSGRSLRFDWDTGFENYNGVWKKVPGNHRKLHVRIRLKQGPGGTNSGIQKIIRFRPTINSAERAAGTFNFQRGRILFYGDDFGSGENTDQTDTATHGPDSFVGQWRDYTDLSVQKFAAWVDGKKIIDSSVQLRTPMPSNLNNHAVMILGTFNSPATNRYDYIDKIDISANYMGVP
jgi:hypothetical protein